MSKWISVKNRLPEIGNQCAPYCWSRKVLCYLTDKTTHLLHLTEVGFWQNFEGKYHVLHESITHWSELPSPPTGDE